MTVYDVLDYKIYLRNWVETRPGGGRGSYRRMAEHLGVSTTLISQVVNGEKHFSLELASDLCEYLGLNERDADQLLLLIELGRAGSHNYKNRLRRRVEKARAQALKLSQRVDRDRDLTDAESAIYYSSWAYTAILQVVATQPDVTADQLEHRLKIPRPAILKSLDFLLETGILLQRKGSYEVGVKKTHIGSESALVIKHHQNWRLQGFSRMAYASEQELFYTGPMSLSQAVADEVRRELPDVIQKIVAMVGPSPSEVVRCLNIDWFSF
jgi:uncharacterized protein (TIGR02147 family)